MEILQKLFESSGFAGEASLAWQNITMFIVGGILITLAIRKNFEPLLLVPIGFGAILANIPGAEMVANDEDLYPVDAKDKWPLFAFIYNYAVSKAELLPPIIFMGVGALTDFRPLLSRPITFLLGAAAQLGIFFAALGAFYLSVLVGKNPGEIFSMEQAAAIGIIGGADGPTTIFLTAKLAPELLGAVAVAAYSYMALVPVIQPPIIKLLTTQKEREIDMPQARPVSKAAVLIFPVATCLITVLFIPASGPLLGMLMFGNLLRESGVTQRLSSTASGPLINIVTIFLGLIVGATMEGTAFLKGSTLAILALGMVAFCLSTAGGVVFAKLLNLVLPSGKKINPCIGAAGVSAVPMAARVVQSFVSGKTNGRVNPLMAAMGPNVAGVVGSAVTAGVFLTLIEAFSK